MKKWDGSAGGYRYRVEKSNFEYFINTDGNIYYKTHSGELVIWCVASQLRLHLQRLRNRCGADLVEVMPI